MNHYLKLMGIEQWRLREANPPSPILPACYAFQLFHEKKCVGLLIAQAEAPSTAIEQMLKKMIAAIRCEGQGEWHPTQPIHAETSELRFVILLGGHLHSELPVKIIKSHSPQTLLDEPKRKAETWEALQGVFPLLAS